MTEIRGQKSEVNSQKSAFTRGLTLSPLPFALSLLCALLFALSFPAQAQQPKKVPRIGYLTSSGRASFEAFATALRQLGYVEGKSIIFEFRTTENTTQLQFELAAEVTQLKVDVIVAVGAGAIRAAKNATSTIPIVMSEVNDPIALGFVASLARPGGNITGMSNLSPELSGKRLEMLKEVVPRASRIAVLAYRGEAMRSSIKETEVAAQSLRLQVQLLEVKAPDEIESAFGCREKATRRCSRADTSRLFQLASAANHRASPQKTGCRQCSTVGLMLRQVGSCRMGTMPWKETSGQRPLSTRF